MWIDKKARKKYSLGSPLLWKKVFQQKNNYDFCEVISFF